MTSVLPCDELGSGPAIVLLHAGVADRRMFAEQLAPLADAGHRVLAPDLPGFGEASVASDEDAPWNDVLATMDALGVGEATIVGNSFGGAVAQRLAVLAPERVAALVLVSSPATGIPPSPQLQEAWAAEEGAIERGDLDGAVAAVLRAWMLPDAPAEQRANLAAMQRRALELQSAASAAAPGEDPLAEDLDALATLDVPALVAVGEHDMSDFHAAAEALAGALPRARRETIAGAGHLAPIERPQAFRRLLLEFVAAGS